MSGTPVLLDVTDTPGENERQVSIRQQPLVAAVAPAANASNRKWRALVAWQPGEVWRQTSS